MIKTILKETSIMLLLCIAIVLVLGVVFYDYIPSNKTVPEKMAAYETPENVAEKINEDVAVEMETKVVTYEVTGAQLDLYKKSNSYKQGKPDPFAASPIVGNVENVEGGNNTSSGGSGTNTNVDPNSVGTFFNDTGLK